MCYKLAKLTWRTWVRQCHWVDHGFILAALLYVSPTHCSFPFPFIQYMYDEFPRITFQQRTRHEIESMTTVLVQYWQSTVRDLDYENHTCNVLECYRYQLRYQRR